MENNIFKKKLLTINKDQISNAKIEFNQNFLYKNLGDIFSDPISSKFTNYSSNHNELLIKSLKNEKDKNKQNFFNKIFNLTFLQCLEHFSCHARPKFRRGNRQHIGETPEQQRTPYRMSH